jgi:hypothetical protein
MKAFFFGKKYVTLIHERGQHFRSLLPIHLIVPRHQGPHPAVEAIGAAETAQMLSSLMNDRPLRYVKKESGVTKNGHSSRPVTFQR